MRNMIIGMLEGSLNILVVVMTIGGFVVGGAAGGVGSMFGGSPSFNMPGALIGGALGFLWAVMGTGIAFVLLKISDQLGQVAHALGVENAEAKEDAEDTEDTEDEGDEDNVDAEQSSVTRVLRVEPAHAPAPHTLVMPLPGNRPATTTAKAVRCPRCGLLNRGRADCWNCGAPLPHS